MHYYKNISIVILAIITSTPTIFGMDKIKKDLDDTQTIMASNVRKLSNSETLDTLDTDTLQQNRDKFNRSKPKKINIMPLLLGVGIPITALITYACYRLYAKLKKNTSQKVSVNVLPHALTHIH